MRSDRYDDPYKDPKEGLAAFAWGCAVFVLVVLGVVLALWVALLTSWGD
jgi:hypothetical protein